MTTDRRPLSDSAHVTSGLRQGGCALCGYIVSGKEGVVDPRWENPVHKKCREALDHWPNIARRGQDDHGWDDHQFDPQVPR